MASRTRFGARPARFDSNNLTMTINGNPLGSDPAELPMYPLGSGPSMNWYDRGNPTGIAGSCLLETVQTALGRVTTQSDDANGRPTTQPASCTWWH